MEVLEEVRLLTAGEYGLVVEFGRAISPEINRLVQQLTGQLSAKQLGGILEVVPAYRSLAVYFDPLILARQELTAHICQLLEGLQDQEQTCLRARLVYVPVCYGGVLGPDLEYVAKYTGLSAAEVVGLHTANPYLVYMLGFTPGFPYLGGLAEPLMVPRQEKPRSKVPAGSVGIGGNQTGLYPVESPGEWWLIGRTPLKAFDVRQSNPFLAAAGDYIQFVSITIDEYFDIRRQVAAGSYELKTAWLGREEASL